MRFLNSPLSIVIERRVSVADMSAGITKTRGSVWAEEQRAHVYPSMYLDHLDVRGAGSSLMVRALLRLVHSKTLPLPFLGSAYHFIVLGNFLFDCYRTRTVAA